MLCSRYQRNIYIILDTLLSKGVLYSIIGSLFILSGLGLPGTGYRVDKKPEMSLGGEPGHPIERMGAIDLMGLEAGQL